MKVFSREKYLRDMKRIDPNGAEVRRGYVWPFTCDGKTEEECNALGCGITPDWMEEKDMGYKERQAEWLKMNNLAIGSRVYVYRKAKNEEGGWRYRWIDYLMDETVGKVAIIVGIRASSLLVEIGDNTFYMPYTALLPVGVTEFEVGRRYKYVGNGGAEQFIHVAIKEADAEALGRGCALMVEALYSYSVKFTVFARDWSFTHMWKDFVALPEKDYYRELDRWIKTNKLKVGDKVRILRSPTLEDMEGWGCSWEEWCDEYIGKALTVVGFDDGDNDIKVQVEKGTFLYVPYTVLEKVEYDIYLELSKALDSVGILTTSARAEGNRITIEGVIR